MRNLLLFCVFTSFMLASCKSDVKLPEMGTYTFFEVDVDELSGLCFNLDKTALLACGDQGVLKTVSFDGSSMDFWSYPSDMEGVALDPATGDIYLAIEGKQEVHVLYAPEHAAQQVSFVVNDAVDGDYRNSGLEAIEFYKDDVLFVGSQRDANLWQYRNDGTLISRISLSSFASEIAGLCYEPDADLLWVTDSRKARIFLCSVDGTVLMTYDVPFIENAESICVDRERGCVWVGSDEDVAKLYRIVFTF